MAIVNPFKQSQCPYCFKYFYLGDCAIVSSQGKELWRKPNGWKGSLNRIWVPSISGPAMGSEGASRRCPHCSLDLPDNLEFVDNQFIALVGATASGKSHYVASLVRDLQRGDVLRHVGCQDFKAVSQKVDKHYYKDYYEPLYIRKEAIPPTQLGATNQPIQPLIYVMVFPGSPTRRINLALFDAAGEDVTQQERIARIARFIANASGIIFLMDPLAIPGVVDLLPTHLVPIDSSDTEGFSMIDQVARQLRIEKNLAPEAPIPIPAAITVAKSDLLKFVLDSQPQFLRQPEYQKGFSVQDFQAVNNEVSAFISAYDNPALLRSSRAFSKVGFFAVSATGAAEYKPGFYRNIKPMRCPDPLLWILWQLGVIRATG